MKITDILKLAMKNLTGHKRIMLRVAVSVLTVVLLCCSAAVFVSAVTDELSDIQYKHIDQACAMVSAYSDTAKQAEDTADDIISKNNRRVRSNLLQRRLSIRYIYDKRISEFRITVKLQ